MTDASKQLSVVSNNTLRLDADIQHPSWYKRRFYMIIGVSLVLLSYLAALSYWQYLIMAVSTLLALVGAAWTNQPLQHVTQPKLTRSLYSDWHLLIDAIHGPELWRGQLLSVQDYGWAVVLRFEITHPSRRTVSHAIYRDQVSPQAWHQLKVLGQVAS